MPFWKDTGRDPWLEPQRDPGGDVGCHEPCCPCAPPRHPGCCDKTQICGTRPGCASCPVRGGLGMGAILQPDEFRVQPQGEGIAQSPALPSCGASWPLLGPFGHPQLLALRFPLLKLGGCARSGPAEGPPKLLQAEIMAKAPGWAESAPHKCWGGAGRLPPSQCLPSIARFCFLPGKHEEKQDEHGFISRCFTRKYT